MTGPEHYRKAEEALAAVESMPIGAEASPAAATLAILGGAHATLALAAATDPGIATEPINRLGEKPPERCGCGKPCPPGEWWCGDPCLELKPEARRG